MISNTIIYYQPSKQIQYSYRGFICSKLKKYKKAEIDYTRAIELYPRYGNYYYSRGDLYMHQKQYNKALQDYKNSIKYRAQYTANAYCNIARIYCIGSRNKSLEEQKRYIAGATKYLKTAVAKGFKSWKILKHPDFKPLQFNSYYKKLLHKNFR